MQKYSIILIYLLTITFNLSSIESGDNKIAKDLFKVYGSNIDLDQIDKVLEFDNNFTPALIKKALLLDENNYNLLEVKKILESTDLTNFSSKLHYISILYRIKKYKEVLQFTKNININNLNDSNTLYYIADSYFRVLDSDKTLEIIDKSLHIFPDDQRFYELLYLIQKDITILTKILYGNNPLQSFLRILSRIDDVFHYQVVNNLIKKELKMLTSDILLTYIGNYEVVETIMKSYNWIIPNGTYRFDNDADTFIETIITFSNGNVIYKSTDTNRDNIYDYKCLYSDGLPQNITFGENNLTYSNYPFVDKITMGEQNRTVFYFYENFNRLELGSSISNQTIQIFNLLLSTGKIVKIESYNNDELSSLTLYRNTNTAMKFTKPSDYGFDNCVLLVDDIPVAGLKDLDSDGIYDLSEKYLEGELISVGYSKNGDNTKISYIESFIDSKETYSNESFDFNWWKK